MDLTIFYVLIAVAVGWVIGFFDSNLRTSKKIRAIEENAERMILDAEKKLAEAKRGASPFAVQDDPGLLRLRKKDGKYILDLDGTTAGGELSLEKRKRLMELITIFRLWLEPAAGMERAVSQPRSAEPDPIREAVYGFNQPAREPVSRAPAQPAAPQSKKPETEKIIASSSIVQQIDAILQESLENTPLAKRGVRLQESSQGGVEVYIGLQKFETVEDVPDLEIKSVIRSAIAEWEKKYTPGM
ncbi:MAG: hypothetical protein LDL50_00700 [Chloroflexi bacterium]|nr:hypothetical protein [Chloroflexota bacterium]MCA2000568.1 hypothetical protein [Chloroflexota bacterium]